MNNYEKRFTPYVRTRYSICCSRTNADTYTRRGETIIEGVDKYQLLGYDINETYIYKDILDMNVSEVLGK